MIYNENRGGTSITSPLPLHVLIQISRLLRFRRQVPANSVVINNFNIAASHINPVTYTGLRVEALYQFNGNWSALKAQSYQNIDAERVFTEMAANSLGEPQPDLSVQLYNPSYDKDRFENTALTLRAAWVI